MQTILFVINHFCNKKYTRNANIKYYRKLNDVQVQCIEQRTHTRKSIVNCMHKPQAYILQYIYIYTIAKKRNGWNQFCVVSSWFTFANFIKRFAFPLCFHFHKHVMFAWTEFISFSPLVHISLLICLLNAF